MLLDPTQDTDSQIRKALLDQSHILKNWSKTKIIGEIVVFAYQDKLIGVQFNPDEQRIIRYFPIQNTTFSQSHHAFVRPHDELPDWIVDALKEWQDGWNNAITSIQNDLKAAISFSTHYTLGGQFLAWVDVDFEPPFDWPKDKRFMRVSLSNRWRISPDLQSTPPTQSRYLDADDVEAIRSSEAEQWEILQELLSGEQLYALHSETEIVAWHNRRPYHIILDTEASQLNIIQMDDWSGESRGFGINLWPSSVLEDLANKAVYGDPRAALRPYTDKLKLQMTELLS